MKTKAESVCDYLNLLLFCLKYLMALIITKRSKGHVPYLYTKINYKSITIYFENKTGKVVKSWYQKKLFTLNMFPKNRKTNHIKQSRME